MNDKDFNAFEKNSGLTFENKTLLVQAFTHRSYLNENRDAKLKHNERLEFLGDAVLEIIVTDYLFKNFPDKAEGELTAYRSALVTTTTLSQVAVKLGMNDYLLLSHGESKDEGRARQYILADTLEALIGAVYLDQGYDKTAEFISKNLLSLLGTIVENRLWQDAKSHFQEEAQERAGITPTYSTVKEIGPDHNKRFVVAVYLNNERVAEGQGQSKQEAEQAAAEKALEAKNW